MNSSLPVINTVLLIANLAIAGFTIDNSEKIIKSQDEIAKTVAESRDRIDKSGSDLDYELSKINRSIGDIRFVCYK